MKDKKFTVMCILGSIWVILLGLTLTGEVKLNPRVEYLVGFICISWFAYWTISTIREYLKSENVSVPLTENNTDSKPTITESANASTKKSKRVGK